MGSKKPIQIAEQKALLDQLNNLANDALESVWSEDGQLFKHLSESFIIQENHNSKSEKEETVLPLQSVQKRLKALENPSQFFKGMIKCHSLIITEGNEDSLDLGYLAPEDYPEHFAWATSVLLNKLYRGRKNNLNALIDSFKKAENHDQFVEILKNDISPDLIDKANNFDQEFEQLNSDLARNPNTVSDFDFLNNAYGLAHLLAEKSNNTATNLPYYHYNLILNAYLDSLTEEECEDSLICQIYANIISVTDYQAMIHSLKITDSFDNILFEHETSLKLKLKEIRNAQDDEEPFDQLNSIQETFITQTLKKIAEYRYKNIQEQALAKTYQDINQLFTDLLNGNINEINFQVNLDKLITKYEPGTDFFTKITAYVVAIIDYITNKDKDTLPRYWNLNKLKAYKGEFAQNFINYLNKLSAPAKKEFLTDYAMNLEHKITSSSQIASLNNSDEKEIVETESADEGTISSVSSQATSKASFWFKRCKDFNGDGDISELIREAVTIEKALVSIAAPGA